MGLQTEKPRLATSCNLLYLILLSTFVKIQSSYGTTASFFPWSKCTEVPREAADNFNLSRSISTLLIPTMHNGYISTCLENFLT
jgi:hypothetical protein